MHFGMYIKSRLMLKKNPTQLFANIQLLSFVRKEKTFSSAVDEKDVFFCKIKV